MQNGRMYHMSLQADVTPCTILYTINGENVDVGKAMVMQPKEQLFHNRLIHPDVFKVSMASVESVHENLSLPVALGGDDDETPWWLGDCKRWVLLWPKSLLRLEVPGSTPTTTQPQQGMNINTTPTQLVSPVVLGDSGRGEEEAPLVANAVTDVEGAMHDIDAIDEDEDDDDTL